MKKLISISILLFIEGICWSAGKINPLTGRYDLVGSASSSGGVTVYPASTTVITPYGIVTTTLTISSLNCSGNANGGALTTDSSGNVVCSDDNSAASGGATIWGQYNETVVSNAVSTITANGVIKATVTASGKMGIFLNYDTTQFSNTASTFTANPSTFTLQGNAVLIASHGSRHQSGGADEISVTGLLGLLSAAQKVAVTTGTTDLAVSTRIAFVAGSGITITPVVGTSSITLTITATASGIGDNLGNHVATMTITAGYGINATTVAVTDDPYAAGWDGSTMIPTKNAVYDKIQSLSAGSGIVATDTVTASGSWTWTNISTADFSGATNLLLPKSSDVSGKISLGSISIDSDDGRTFIGVGTVQKPIISSMTFQVFTTTGTYTPNPRMAFCKVYVTGTGGSAATCTATDCESGGGGAGGTAIKIFTPADIGASKAVGIPAAPTTGTAGASTTFGTLISVPSGTQGANSGATTTVGANGAAGTGSTPTGGDINILGGDGTSGICYSTNFGSGGNGGSSLWGGGGWGFTGASAVGGNGNDGKAYGSGAGGCYAPDATDRNSGTGGGGLVIVQEFLN